MVSSAVSAVLFAKDHAKVAAFYRDALGFLCTSSGEDHSVLNCGGFELVVHQIPTHESAERNEDLPTRREYAALRLEFPVDSINKARSRATAMGGQIDDAPPPWAPKDANIYLGHDPEGNVFKLRQRRP